MAIFILKRHWRIVCPCVVFWSISAFLLCGCSTVEPPPTPPGHPKPYKVGQTWYKPLPDAKSFIQRGKASWYGSEFHGKKTANGEIYNMYAMTAAHKTLPFETLVGVRNIKNNRVIEVRINDRGPFVRGRIIDLSYTAAKKLGMVGPGTADVVIVALTESIQSDISNSNTTSYPATDLYEGNFTVQIGAFGEMKNAERLREKLARTYSNVYITSYFNGRDTFYRVKVGKYTNLAQANRFERIMVQNGYKNAFAIAEDSDHP
ncbi:MAG: septal ring lytic transglycosylase RlpA family protein [Deltaproteobacteria bacterium]|jgi:rare lipoprotein A|nr:septal ring lytic transglycosylase RlpA family protein [Deltaproteobacteria bacterium]